MPKVGMQRIRRRQLIRATVETIGTHGFAETTIARISRRAGLSTGIISHYFGGKNELLAASMRWLLRQLQRETGRRLRRSGSATERIESILGASFDSEQFTPIVSTVWLSFYAQIPHEPELARLHRVYMRRLRSNLRHAFRQLMPDAASDEAAEGMASMIDGIWVRMALAGQEGDIRRARRLASDYLYMLLEYHQCADTGYQNGMTGTR